MKAKKLGRPRIAKSEFKGVLIGARFKAVEAKQVHDAIKLSGQEKSDWIRKTLLGAAESGKV